MAGQIRNQNNPVVFFDIAIGILQKNKIKNNKLK